MKVDVNNIRIQCNGMTDEKLQKLYDFLNEKGIMTKFKQLINEGEDIDSLVNSMNEELDYLIEENYWINAYIDYCADMREIPYWMGKERIAEAIIDDLIEGK